MVLELMMEVRMVLSTVSGSFMSWLNAYVVHDEEEEIESVIPMAMVVCLARRPRPVRGLSL
jgi:hypothetical protein